MSFTDYDHLLVSAGAGDAVLMHIQSNRTAGATTIVVDSVVNVPSKFIGTTGTLIGSGSQQYIDPTTKMDFTGHLNSGNLIIDAVEPGSTDVGNTSGQVVVIKPNTGWANRVATVIMNLTGFGTPQALTVSTLTATEVSTPSRTLNTVMPSGGVIPFAGASVPTGYLLCNGQAVSRTTYAALFTALGTTYGAGDGSTTFNVPDLRHRTPFGYDAGDANFNVLGLQGGNEAINLAHNHGTDVQGYHSHTTQAEFYNGGLATNVLTQLSSNTPPGHQHNTDTQGGHGHNITTSLGSTNILNPFIAMNYIIKT